MHPDHVGGVHALRERLGDVNVAAHRLTAEPLTGTVAVDRFIADNEVIELQGPPFIRLQALHTPGHARGHLCFYEARTGTLLSGDNIVGLGSVLIEPEEGNMRDYLQSLHRMKQLPDLSVIFGGHGPAMGNPYQKIDEYISHRLEREQNILSAINEGAATVKEIVARVYTDVSPKAHPMAERAVLAHVEKLIEDGAISQEMWAASRQCSESRL
jgi:glyoxylase-like metal-dependent hydrolase (beta-lactamase superfamily II)